MVERSAGAIIFRTTKKGPEYLLLQHPDRDNQRVSKPARGHWDFPKGHIEKGEKTEDAVQREVREETGVVGFKIIPGFKETIRYFVNPVRNKRSKVSPHAPPYRISNGVNYHTARHLKFVAFFLGKTASKKVIISWEHQGYAWLSFEEAYTRLTYANAKEILKKADQFIREKSV